MIERVRERFSSLKYMKHEQAQYMRDLIVKHDLKDLLELGTYHGKSTAYMASILEELGRGIVTTLDRTSCMGLSPNVKQVIAELGLEHRVHIELHPRSFTITLMEMLEQTPRPQFDFCYLDGAHTWDGTGYSFLLVDKLLKPGAWLVMDDLDWTIAKSPIYRKALEEGKRSKAWHEYGSDEIHMTQVRKVWEILVPDAGYVNRSEPGFKWGLAQKPK